MNGPTTNLVGCLATTTDSKISSAVAAFKAADPPKSRSPRSRRPLSPFDVPPLRHAVASISTLKVLVRRSLPAYSVCLPACQPTYILRNSSSRGDSLQPKHTTPSRIKNHSAHRHTHSQVSLRISLAPLLARWLLYRSMRFYSFIIFSYRSIIPSLPKNSFSSLPELLERPDRKKKKRYARTRRTYDDDDEEKAKKGAPPRRRRVGRYPPWWGGRPEDAKVGTNGAATTQTMGIYRCPFPSTAPAAFVKNVDDYVRCGARLSLRYAASSSMTRASPPQHSTDQTLPSSH